MERGRDGRGDNPFFYVSNSGWGLYNLIDRFIDEHYLPPGPMLIRAVTPPERDAEVRQIIQDIADMGVAAAAAESSLSLARAAADFDLIPHDAIADVREAMVEE